MNSSNRNKMSIKHQDTMPVFFTGLSHGVQNSDPIPVLCKLCKRILEDDCDPEQLCSACIISPKKLDNSSSSTDVKSNKHDHSATYSKPSFERYSPAHREKHHLSSTPTTSNSSFPQYNSFGEYPTHTRNSQNTSYEEYPSHASNSQHISFGEYPSHGSNSQSMVSYPASQSQKWKSSVQERHHGRSYSAPYSSRPNRDYNGRDDGYSASPALQRRRPPDEVEQYHIMRNERRTVSRANMIPEFREHDGLSAQIWDLFHKNKQTDEIFNSKMALRNKLHGFLVKAFPTCALYVVGSSMTWLGAQTSDIDMCLMLTHFELDQKKEAISILQKVRTLFRKNRYQANMQLIPAKVPILKFVDFQSNFEVDLNINNSVGIRNTQLLSSYARIDQRLAPLVVLIKLWASHHGINDAKTGSLSSYSIVLMVIHFLQYRCNPPVLPSLQVLQPDKYDPEADIRTLRPDEELPPFKSDNSSDLAELFLGFLKYFAHEFNYRTQAISVRLATILSKTAVVNYESPKNKKTDWKILCIEEPFDLTNVARSIYSEEVFKFVQYVFDESWRRLKREGDLRCLFV